MISTVTEAEFQIPDEDQTDREVSWNGRKIRPMSEDSITISITWEFKLINVSVQPSRR